MEWISVEERLPEEYTEVLCFYGKEEYGIDYLNTKGHFMSEYPIQPTHWMALPGPPKNN